MTPESIRENKDLTAHTYNRISEICMQTASLTADTGTVVGVPISACILVVLDILSAAEKTCPDPSIIARYRREVADRILGKSHGSVSVGSDGVRPLE